MGIEKKVYSFRFDEDMVEKLRLYGQQENRPLSNLVETVLLDYLARRERETSGQDRNEDPAQT